MGKEKIFENKVRAYLKSIGAYAVKYWGGLLTTAGVPDLLVSYKGRFIGIELKAETGKPSKLQLYHKREIEKTGGISIVLYPHQFMRFKKFMEELETAPDIVHCLDLEGVNKSWL